MESASNNKRYFGMKALPKRIVNIADAATLSKKKKLLLIAQVFNEIYLLHW